ncbi:MAG: hypothetical protein J4F49_13235 [Rhodobacteraceae bacterium]|nr:hypothetical protein [Paracoccaceae bacterium]
MNIMNTSCSMLQTRALLANSADVTALRHHIAALEHRSSALCSSVVGTGLSKSWWLGVPALDAALPETGLMVDGLHEAAGATVADGPTASAFLAALLARFTDDDRGNPVLICQSRHGMARFGRVHGPGWRDLGLEPANLLVLRAGRDGDVPWAIEEGLRCGVLAAVLAEVEELSFTASRRLSLAAREGATPALLVRHDGLGSASAACTRWRVSALPGGSDPFDEDAPGLPRWQLELVRCRGGRPVTCNVEWNRETGNFHMAAALAD